ncbi:MAG: hypothetical protein ACRD6U_01320 [Nitrososphaeraceae archaeon]
MYQQVDGQLDYVKEAHLLKLEYYEDWKLTKDTQSETDSEYAKLLSKKVGEVVNPAFNHFYSVKLIPYKENTEYVSMLDDTTVFSVTLYPNMSSLEKDKVYKNMSSLADTRIYTNLSSLGDKVFPNMSSLESSKVFPNMSSLESSKVFPNMSSLIK